MDRSCSQRSYLRGAFTAVGACGYRCCLGLAGGIHARVALQVSLTLLVNWKLARGNKVEMSAAASTVRERRQLSYLRRAGHGLRAVPARRTACCPA